MVYNASRQCSEVVILDAQEMEASPVATLRLPHHLPYGLHGNWVDEYFGPPSWAYRTII